MMKSIGTDADAIEVLLVEDSPGDVRLTREAFKDAKVHINLHVASDGAEAMAFLKREGEHANAPRPDLILLDLNLPKKDGREVLAEIKESPTLKSIPVVILTTSASEADILRSYQLHANCYITKPVGLDGFLESREEHRQFLAVRGQVAARSRQLMKEKALQVLLVEDNAGDVRLLREMFSKEKAGQFRIDAPLAHE